MALYQFPIPVQLALAIDMVYAVAGMEIPIEMQMC